MEQTLCKFKPNPKPTLRLGTSRILLNLVISADVQKEHAHLVFLYSFTMKFLMLNWVGMIQLMFGLLMKMFMKKMWVQEFFCEINLHLKNLFIFWETNFTKLAQVHKYYGSPEFTKRHYLVSHFYKIVFMIITWSEQ